MNEESRSLKSKITDVLLTEIPLPFGAKGSDKEQKLDRVLAELEQQGRVIGDLLVGKGIVTEEQLEQVARHQQRLNCTWTQALVDHNLVPPSRISDVLAVMERELHDRESGQSLEEVLAAKGAVSGEALEKAQTHARAEHLSLEQGLLATGALTLEELGAIYKESFGIGYVDLSKVQVTRSTVNLVPDNVITTFDLLPVRRAGDALEVAMCDPRDKTAVDKLQLLTRMSIVPLLADRRQIVEQQKQFVLTFAPSKPAKDVEKPRTVTQMKELIDQDSTVKMVEKIVEGAQNAGATDIHLEPAEEHLRIRYRIDGLLYDIMTVPRKMGIPTISRVKVLAGMDITERRRPQDGRVSMAVGGNEVKMRAATLNTHEGEKVVLRILSNQGALMGRGELGFLDSQMERVERLMKRPNGMLLVTGPIGCGKTTTLYSILHDLNQPHVNIVTIEDPVEFPLPGVNQVQVDRKTGIDFASGLRAVLRQDANILMVGEIRDPETAQTAVRAAMTGHILLSTLHTNSAVSAVSTLRHLDVRPFMIGSCLLGVIAQRLIRKVCPSCAKMALPDAAARKELGLTAKNRKKMPVATGCSACYGTGYKGRSGVFEVLEVTDSLRGLVTEGVSDSEIAAAAKKDRMQSLLDAGKAKVLAGETTLEEVMRVLYAE